MQRTNRPLLAASLLIALTPLDARAQAAQGRPPAVPQDLSIFEGRYEYRDSATLVMIARDGRLVAVISEAKYPLRSVAVDTFMNGAGERIPFVRDDAGRIVAFQEYGDTFARISTVIEEGARQLFEPRPPGPDGRPAPYRCAAPTALADGIRVAQPGAETVSCAVAARMVNGVVDGTYPDVRSILVVHRGRLVLEEYFYGYDRGRPHQMRSLTKSVISLLAGAAVDRGLVSPDEPVLPRLGYASVANPDPRKGRITLTHLLSNQSGLACDDYDGASPGNESKLYDTPDWPKAFIDLPALAEPGTVGRYCSFGFKAVRRLVERAAGRPLPDFAHEVLFEPLGIRREAWRWSYVLDRSQRNEFGQIYLRPRDMLKLGLLIKQRGTWEGRRILSESWIDATVGKQSRVDDSDYGLGLWHRWYGVQTAGGTRRVDTIMLSGNGGQKVYIVPSLDLVAVFTGGAFNDESAANTLMAGVLLPALLEAGVAGPGAP